MRTLFFVSAALALVLFSARVYAADTSRVPRITVEELKAKIESGEGIVILDVRSGGSYRSSKVKIRGAVRMAYGDLDEKFVELPMGREIITYCT